MPITNPAAEQLKDLARHCSREVALGDGDYGQRFLGIGKTVVASAQELPTIGSCAIYAIGSVDDTRRYAQLNVKFFAPVPHLMHEGLLRHFLRIGMHITDEVAAITIDREDGKYKNVPLAPLVAPLGQWAVDVFPGAEEPSDRFYEACANEETSRETIEALKAQLSHPLDDLDGETQFTRFFYSTDVSPGTFKWVNVTGQVYPVIRVVLPE